jgi:hypothetical protein
MCHALYTAVSFILLSLDPTKKSINRSIWSSSRNISYIVGGNSDQTIFTLAVSQLQVLWPRLSQFHLSTLFISIRVSLLSTMYNLNKSY